MNFHDDDRLWRGVFDGEELAALRRSTLQAGLVAVRARRRRRRLLMFVGAAAPLAVILALGFFRYRATGKNATDALPDSASTVPTVRLINDAELLALFPNRAVALMGRPGHQELRFLDSPPKSGD